MNSRLPIYDAHNHLHDARLAPALPSIISELESLPLQKAVVNGTRSEDWPQVAILARSHKWVIPSFGLHPWYVNQACENWRSDLQTHLQSSRSAIGEIGLDRWIKDYDSAKQEDAFIYQLQLAAKLNLPVTIHCLKAWGRLLEILQSQKLPAGFLLHSYGGPAEMIHAFVNLGGYFSLSGYFAHPRKQRQREVFRTIPPDRLLLETDAPDMSLPAERSPINLKDSHGEDLNHPANILAVYTFAAELYETDSQELGRRIEANFLQLFGPFCQ